jgi:multiple sugar transport system ATP-binding protein
MFVAGFIGSPAMNMFLVDVEGDDQGLFLKGPGFRVRVPEQYAQRLTGYKAKRMVMGLRPEAIHDVRFMPGADPATVVTAQVDVVEPLGRDMYLYLTTGDQSFVARVDDRTDTSAGKSIRVVFDTANMHAFDPESERSLL